MVLWDPGLHLGLSPIYCAFLKVLLCTCRERAADLRCYCGLNCILARHDLFNKASSVSYTSSPVRDTFLMHLPSSMEGIGKYLLDLISLSCMRQWPCICQNQTCRRTYGLFHMSRFCTVPSLRTAFIMATIKKWFSYS